MGGAADCGVGFQRRSSRRSCAGRLGGRPAFRWSRRHDRCLVRARWHRRRLPSAKDRLDRNFAYPTDRSPPLTPAIQGGVNLGLIFYPWRSSRRSSPSLVASARKAWAAALGAPPRAAPPASATPIHNATIDVTLNEGTGTRRPSYP